MKQKTINKMRKFCKESGWRLGQLIINLSYPLDPFFIPDSELSRKFSKLWTQRKQHLVKTVDSLHRRIPATWPRPVRTAVAKGPVVKVKIKTHET